MTATRWTEADLVQHLVGRGGNMSDGPIRRHRGSLATRILTVLQDVQGQPRHFAWIAEKLGDEKPHYVGNACVRMAHRGILQRVEEGTYRIRPWEGGNGA